MNNKIFKIVILMITILVPIICMVGIGAYSYNRYDPEVNTDLDVEFKREITTQHGGSTLERIQLYRKFESYYYEEDPIFVKDVELDGEKIYTIALYRSFSVINDPNEGTSGYATRYDLFIYNVNYTKLLNELKKQFQDNSLVYDYSDPNFIVNFYPTDELDKENALFGEDGRETNNNVATIVLYDVNSTPQLKGEVPYHVHRVLIRENQISKSLIKAFTEGKAYMTVDAQVYKDYQEGEETQRYSKTITTLDGEKIDDFVLEASKFDVEKYEKGWREAGVRDTLNNAGYKNWIFKKYIWWQALLALVISSAIMVGFYFAFTYQEPSKPNKRRNK